MLTERLEDETAIFLYNENLGNIKEMQWRWPNGFENTCCVNKLGMVNSELIDQFFLKIPRLRRRRWARGFKRRL